MMRVTKPKTFLPWYKQSKNQFVTESVWFDCDRQGNLFHLDVYESLNKDGELVRDIMRVRRLGHVDDRNGVALAAIFTAEFADAWWPRCLESKDFLLVIDSLGNRLEPAPRTPIVRQYHEKTINRWEQYNASCSR